MELYEIKFLTEIQSELRVSYQKASRFNWLHRIRIGNLQKRLNALINKYAKRYVCRKTPQS